MTEDAIRCRFRSRVRMQCPEVWIVGSTNAGKRGQRALNQARREGAVWGFPDDTVLWPGGVAFIEWKTPRTKPDDRQLDVHARLRRMGFPVLVCSDPDEALGWLRGLGAPFDCQEAA